MDKPLLIGELAKIKFFDDLMQTEIQKSDSDVQVIKDNMDSLRDSFDIVYKEVLFNL